jgi:hypothetical protein
MNRVGHGLLGVPDAGVFLTRLVRLDPAALVRLRPLPPAAPEAPRDGQTEAARGRTALWGRLPWQVLVTRTVDGSAPAEATVAAADLLAVLSAGGPDLPVRRDADWLWPLPPPGASVVETITAGELHRIAEAAAGTLRTAAAARRVGERVVRDALLDHVPIVVTSADGERVEVPQRLVQAVVRMGFLGASGTSATDPVQVRIAGKWTALAAPYGSAWLRPMTELAVRPLAVHTNG